MASIGPGPMRAGSPPLTAVAMTRARGVRFSRAATSPVTSTAAAAPSFSGQEFPAVTLPPPRNAGGSAASRSREVSQRGPSSVSTRVPSASGTPAISRAV